MTESMRYHKHPAGIVFPYQQEGSCRADTPVLWDVFATVPRLSLLLHLTHMSLVQNHHDISLTNQSLEPDQQTRVKRRV